MWHAWERNVYRVLMGNPEGKRPLGRPRCRWEDGIRMDLEEIGLGSVDWIQLAQNRDRWRALVNTVMNLRVLVPRNYLFICTLFNDVCPVTQPTYIAWNEVVISE
jgi:hypothetical protein